jgi:hypothetical protein
MSYETILQSVANPTKLNAHFFQLAARCTDPVERMKYVIGGSVAYIHYAHHWNKPLNPILGETYQSQGDDGAMIYLEKVQHRPPVTYFLCTGAKNAYRWYGYDSFAAHGHLNSISVTV